MKRVFALLVAMLIAITAVGCDRGNANTTEPTDDPSKHPVRPKAGTVFMDTGFKIRSEIAPKGTTEEPLVFEVYVDGEGDGAGLLGYGANTYQCYLVGGEIYVVTADRVTVHVTDIDAHMVPATLDVYSIDNMKANGFTVVDSIVTEYKGSTDDVNIVSRYEVSTAPYTPAAVSQTNSMTLLQMRDVYLEASEQNPGSVPTPGGDNGEDTTPDRPSFYNNSSFGLTIHGAAVYSLGDYCNPYDYFEDMVPQGMIVKEDKRGDQAVSFLYVSYIGSDGNVTFVTTEGYVQAITTTCQFTFLDVIKKGMTQEELEALLGTKLKKEEDIAAFVPIVEGLTATQDKTNFSLTYGDIQIELECDSKLKTLQSITIANYLDFRS